MLIKVQRSVATSHDRPQVMAYDKDKEFVYTGPLSAEISKFMGSDLKVYALADLRVRVRKGRKVKKWHIYKRSARQDYDW